MSGYGHADSLAGSMAQAMSTRALADLLGLPLEDVVLALVELAELEQRLPDHLLRHLPPLMVDRTMVTVRGQFAVAGRNRLRRMSAVDVFGDVNASYAGAT